MEQMLNVTEHTEKLLASRMDDYRINMIHDVLYSDDFGGINPERNFTFVGKDNKEEQHHIRKAAVLDTYQYTQVSGNEAMGKVIENNIINVMKMKKLGSANPNQTGIKRVFVLIFTTNENGEILFDAWMNPDASDCSSIIHGKNTIAMCSFIVEYADNPTFAKLLKESNPGREDVTNVMEFSFFGPMDISNLEEYKKWAYEKEKKQLSEIFMINF